jgi:three-Cys-motif partner protein
MIASPAGFKLDEIGNWSEIKLEIIRKYAKAYSTILTSKGFFHSYIDGFSGAGVHVSKTTGTLVQGSPTLALEVEPPFDEYHFVDLNSKKIDHLRRWLPDRPNIHSYTGNCNDVLIQQVFSRVLYTHRRRALCLLDPYGLHLSWEVMRLAGQMKSIELFINFPMADMNRNVLWHDADGATAEDVARMNFFWGDDSWRSVAYRTDNNLFGFADKTTNEAVVEGFKQRLMNVAGFAYVPKPLPMKNSRGATVYYIFFASPNKTANKIVTDIFNKYR